MPYDPNSPEVQAALLPQRLLAIAADEGWFDVTARDPIPYPGRVELTWYSHTRVLDLPEVEPYVRGVAYAYGQPDILPLELGPLALPELVSVDEYADLFRKPAPSTAPPGQIDDGPLSRDGVISRITRYTSHHVYLRGRERALFAAEALALRPHPRQEDVDAWNQIRKDWALARLTRLGEIHSEPGLRLDQPETHRRGAALMRGGQEGWFVFHQPDEDADGLIFTITIENRLVELPAAWVHPFVLGVADRHGPPDNRRVTYRRGM